MNAPSPSGNIRSFDLVASDLDGTLLGWDEKVSPRTRLAIKRVLASGARFVFATGRPPRWIRPVAEEVEHFGFAVGSNGAVIVEVHSDPLLDRVVRSNLLSIEVALRSIEAVRRALPGVAFAVDSPDGFGHEPHYVPSWETPGKVAIAPVDQLVNGPLLKILFKHPEMNESNYRKVIDIVGDTASITFGSMVPIPGHNTLIELMAPGCSKASALQWICDHDGIHSDRVIAFGDMPNDLEMLAWAGHGVAMGNAHDTIKAVANAVTLSNSEDGVAHILEQYF